MIVTAYQTLEDRNNKTEVEKNGPFPCLPKGSWLGYGYYLWDTNLKWAEEWGKGYIKKGKKYYIGECKVDLSKDCFDLYGSVKSEMELIEIIDVWKKSGKWKPQHKRLILPSLIQFMKQNGIFTYKSIRASDDPKPIELHFKIDSKESTIINQRVQICVIDIEHVILKPFSIIYP